MSDPATTLAGPDLAMGVPISKIDGGAMLLGHANGEPVVLAQRGHELFAFDAFYTHYGAPLGDGLLVDDTAALASAMSILFVVILGHGVRFH